MPRAPRWTDSQLRDAIASSRTLAEVSRKLGIMPGGYRTLRRHILRLGLDAGHLSTDTTITLRSRRRWTDDEFADVVRTSYTVSEVSRRLGYQVNGGIHRFVVGHIRRLDLDVSHFTGRAWAKGRRFADRPQMPLEEALVVNSPFRNTGRLRARLIKAGLKQPQCEDCGLREWQGRPLPLALDHINGDHTDNRLENLRILCPNCHALTDTWCVRKPA